MAYKVKGEPAPGRPEGAIEPDHSLPSVCVIGAGSAGIAAVKALYEARIPDYPMHWQVREYFDRYVDHFGLRNQIALETKVERVAPAADDDGYSVEISGVGVDGGGERRSYDAVIVCNGHHWDPRWPEPAFPGDFDGTEIHAHDYREASRLEGRKVVILGVGNGGMDIAVASSYVAESTVLAHRRGAHVIRKRLRGKPVDQTLLPSWLPWSIKQKGFEVLAKLSGDVSEHGMAEPDHKVGHAHPTSPTSSMTASPMDGSPPSPISPSCAETASPSPTAARSRPT